MYIFLISYNGKIIMAIVLNRTKFPAFTYRNRNIPSMTTWKLTV